MMIHLSYLFIGLTALLPRLLSLGSFVTHDEASFWLRRSETFLDAIRSGDFAATAIAVHPGVTTMWLGSVGILLRRTLRDWEIIPEISFPLLLMLMRLPVVLVHVAGILVGYWLLRRLFSADVAFLAALLWATDPFIIGYSRLLHVDALAATFATLSLLTLCLYWQSRRTIPTTESTPLTRYTMLIACGGCAALAVLSKSPALALLPVVVVVIAVASWRQSDSTGEYPSQKSGVRALCSALLVWGIAFGLTILLVWPAAWADPQGVYELLRFGVAGEGAQPHMTGNFFLGRADPEPGPHFYPVALALRLTPWAVLGVFLLGIRVFALSKARRRSDDATLGVSGNYRTIAVLAGFVILFIIAMSLFPKKFNRYLLPAFPAVNIVAAVGLAWGMRWLSGVGGQRTGKAVFNGLLALCSGIAVFNAAWWHPYYLAAFNQMLGGARAGAHTFSVGWGEGLEQVAAWLNQQPDITGRVTAADATLLLNPYLKHGAQATSPQDGTLPDQSGYVVVSIYQAQGTVFPPFDQFYGRAAPLHTVRIHGVEYAWIYQVPPAVAHPLPADFGNAIHLRGFEMVSTPQRGETVTFKLFWQARAAPRTDYWLFAHLVGPHGERSVQVDMPSQSSTWDTNHFITTDIPITIPADALPGTYRLLVGLYDPANGNRLVVTEQPPAHTDNGEDDLTDTLDLTHISLE